MRRQSPYISHDAEIVKELRGNPKFAAEYLKAALEDQENPRVLLIAMRQLAEARGENREDRQSGYW
jgi:DNA-binding phage protein